MTRIGITTSFENQHQRLHHAYVKAVERAGGLPLLVPMLDNDDATRAVADLLDGLVIIGGDAVTDGLIGDLPNDLAATEPLRRASDACLLDAILEAGKPVLGICYGMQVLNARAGGRIYADVQRQHPKALAHSQKRGADTHLVTLADGSHLRTILQTEVIEVNTRHVQAVETVGQGFRVAATAPDGVIEAIENNDGTVIGVQFHPERMGETMQPLFRHLVACAQRQKNETTRLITALL